MRHTGGGFAGLSAAEKLAQNGISVTVYDMGRSPGMAWHSLRGSQITSPQVRQEKV